MKSENSKAFKSLQDLKVIKEKMQQSEQQEKEKRQKRFEAVKKVIEQLKSSYPVVFNAEKPLPLTIGSEKEIFKHHPELAKSIIRFALAIWTKRERYLNAVVSEEHRHNLDGSIAAKIQESEKIYSKALLKKKSYKLKK